MKKSPRLTSFGFEKPAAKKEEEDNDNAYASSSAATR
jgi:hypothetical protein